MVTFPNPDPVDLHFEALHHGPQLGDRYDAARAAGVKPGTIPVWVTRKKIEPVLEGPDGPLFHLPTIRRAAEAGRAHTPANPAANRRRTTQAAA